MHDESFFGNTIDGRVQTPPIKIIMADDHPIFTNGIAAIFNEVPGVEFCGSFLNGKDLLDWYDGTNADIILLDAFMPVLDGIETSMQLLNGFPGVKIIILSANDHYPLVWAMRRIGVFAYLSKNTEPELIMQTILKVHAGEKCFFGREFANVESDIADVTGATGNRLSDREVQVLKLITQGLTNLQIADQLNISELTIKTHRQNLRRKLNAHNIAQLIERARQKGLI